MTAMQLIDIDSLDTVTGGANAAGQARLRALAKSWCPSTYARYGQAPTLTRRMGERCLDEAGLGAYKSQLDAYFK